MKIVRFPSYLRALRKLGTSEDDVAALEARLERFQEKCAALFRFENATNQRLAEHFPIPSNRKML
jgi:hypothetical protein